MSNHLSSKQFSKWLVGECTPEEQAHGRECPQCGAELSRFQNAMVEFRSSVSHWAVRSSPKVPGLAQIPRRSRARPLRWAAVAAAVAVLAVAPIYKNSIDRQREAEAAEDAQLLETVNEHLSRSAPLPFEPLMDLQNNGGPR